MPNTSSPVSADRDVLHPRLGMLFCGLLLTAIAVAGIWTATAGEAGGRTHTVVMEGMKFSPATLHIEAGDRVMFKNADMVPHTATAKDATIFDSGLIKPGDSWTVSPPTGGTVRYVCTYHPMMEGEIIARKP